MNNDKCIYRLPYVKIDRWKVTRFKSVLAANDETITDWILRKIQEEIKHINQDGSFKSE